MREISQMREKGYQMANHLPEKFWQNPSVAESTLTTAALRETLLYHDGGYISAKGYIWDIVARKMGAGVYHVSLRRRAR